MEKTIPPKELKANLIRHQSQILNPDLSQYSLLMKNPYITRFPLKQHTPIIHFEYGLQGSTLRMTELKPKFDKFILSKLGENIPEDNNLFWVGGEKQGSAINYQARIISDGKLDVQPILPNQRPPVPFFLGNMGGAIEYAENMKGLVTLLSPFTIQFFSHIPEVLKKIEEYFPLFISTTNFGTRQNKGYGSFSLWDDKENKVLPLGALLDEYPYLQVRTDNWRRIMLAIQYYYQRLKSGINYRNHYHKAFLRLYLEDKPYTWEKAWIKELFIARNPNPNKAEELNARFVRALLGLSSKFEYKPNRRGERGPYPDREVTIDIENENIKRIKSPITFKPIILGKECRIYIIPNEFSTEEITQIANKTFTFGSNSRRTLNTPAVREFFRISDLITAYNTHLGRKF